MVLIVAVVPEVVTDAQHRLPELASGVHGEPFLPTNGVSPRAALILLHGIEGPRPIYASEGRMLAADGYVVLVLDFYAEAKGGVWTAQQRATLGRLPGGGRKGGALRARPF